MKKVLSVLVVLLVVTLSGCNSVPSREEQFYYGDLYFGMSKKEVLETAEGSFYSEDEDLLVFKTFGSPYSTTMDEQTVLYDFAANKLNSIMVYYKNAGTKEEVLEELKYLISKDYGEYTEKENYDNSIGYLWETPLVRVTLEYDDVTSRAYVYYYRMVF